MRSVGAGNEMAKTESLGEMGTVMSGTAEPVMLNAGRVGGVSSAELCVAGNTLLENMNLDTLQPGTPEFAVECRKLDKRPFGYRFTKRAFDVCFSACVITVGLIPSLALCAAIAIDTKGFPIYSQKRAGRLGRPIRIFKFRSMVADADNVEKYLSEEQIAEWKRERKVTNDPRITKLGRILRKTSLDEIPQFVNVLTGELSVVGPRAISYEELENFDYRGQLRLLSVPQGITGAWQAGPRNLASFDNGLRQQLELTYADCASIKADLGVFFATFGVMFGKKKTGR